MSTNIFWFEMATFCRVEISSALLWRHSPESVCTQPFIPVCPHTVARSYFVRGFRCWANFNYIMCLKWRLGLKNRAPRKLWVPKEMGLKLTIEKVWKTAPFLIHHQFASWMYPKAIPLSCKRGKTEIDWIWSSGDVSAVPIYLPKWPPSDNPLYR